MCGQGTMDGGVHKRCGRHDSHDAKSGLSVHHSSWYRGHSSLRRWFAEMWGVQLDWRFGLPRNIQCILDRDGRFWFEAQTCLEAHAHHPVHPLHLTNIGPRASSLGHLVSSIFLSSFYHTCSCEDVLPNSFSKGKLPYISCNNSNERWLRGVRGIFIFTSECEV